MQTSFIAPNIYNVYRPVPQHIINKYYSGYKNITIPANAHIIQESEISGLEDCVSLLEQKIQQHSAIVLPNVEIPIKNKGWVLRSLSQKSIFFQQNSIIKVKGLGRNKSSDSENILHGSGISLFDCENISFYNVQIQGNINASGQEGEYAHGIGIFDSENIVIDTVKIWNCWGDGIFIGSENIRLSSNIYVNNIFIDNCGRNAISVTLASNVKIFNVLLANTLRIDPKCGVDIEPSSYYETFQDIHFKNLGTWQNALNGFNIYTRVNGSDTNEKHPYQFSVKLEDWDNYFSYNGLGLNMLGLTNSGGRRFFKHNIFGIVEIKNVNFHVENHNTDFVNDFLKEIKQANGITSSFKMIVENVKVIQPDSVVKITTNFNGLFEYKSGNVVDVVKVSGGKAIPKFLTEKADKKIVDLSGSTGDSIVTIKQRGMDTFSMYQIPANICNSVKTLDFSNANGVNAILAFNMNNLTTFDLSGMTELRRLLLGNINNLTSITGLNNCRNLSELSLSQCNNLEAFPFIFDNSFWNLAILKLVEFTNLTSLDLSRFDKLVILSIQKCNALTSIDISTHPKLTDFQVKNCANLTTIYVSQQQMDKINSGQLPKWVKDTNVNYVIK